ncbi:MAG: hypothetical protein WC683_06385 [bacterium]
MTSRLSTIELAAVMTAVRASAPPIRCTHNGGRVPEFAGEPGPPGVWACGWVEQADVTLEPESSSALVALPRELADRLPEPERAILRAREVTPAKPTTTVTTVVVGRST